MVVCGLNNHENSAKTRNISSIFIKLLPLIAFAVPLALLYFLNPMDPYLNISAQEFFPVNVEGKNFPVVLHLAGCVGVYSKLGKH